MRTDPGSDLTTKSTEKTQKHTEKKESGAEEGVKNVEWGRETLFDANFTKDSKPYKMDL